MELTRANYEKILPYKNTILQAHSSKYVRGLTPESIRDIVSIYREATNDKQPIIVSCGTCVMNLLHRCARMITKYEAKDDRNTNKKRGRNDNK